MSPAFLQKADAVSARGGLRHDEAAVLVARARGGDRAAAETLIASVYRLIARDARRLARASGCAEDDLTQEGCFGVMVALQKFDPTKGVAFATYATRCWLSRMFRHSLESRRLVKASVVQRVVGRVNRATRALTAAGAEPTDAAVAVRCGLAEGDVAEVRRYLSERDVDLGARALEVADEKPGPDAALAERSEREHFARELAGLAGGFTLQEQDLLCDVILAEEPHPLPLVAARHGMSHGRMSSLRRQLIAKLRTHFGAGVAPARGEAA